MKKLYLLTEDDSYNIAARLRHISNTILNRPYVGRGYPLNKGSFNKDYWGVIVGDLKNILYIIKKSEGGFKEKE